MKVYFFASSTVYLVECKSILSDLEIQKLEWILQASSIESKELTHSYVGTKVEMITPWSTNAVEICQACGLNQIVRLEFFKRAKGYVNFDSMRQKKYNGLSSRSLQAKTTKAPIEKVRCLKKYNEQWGLALSQDELRYLEKTSKSWKRPLTDSEVFGFAQINSEHCRHKVFKRSFLYRSEKKATIVI